MGQGSYFANANHYVQQIKKLIKQYTYTVKAVVVDIGASFKLDVTSVNSFKEVFPFMERINFLVA